jgi:hypothetical protein
MGKNVMQRIDRWPSFLSLVVLITALTVPSAPAQAQDALLVAPRVFLDCRGRDCNSTYFRTEITWVTWVRDQRDAHVHVIWTSQRTGVGGQEYILDFTGSEAYPDYEAQSRYQSLPTDTQRERLDALTLTLGLGLATFATESGFRNLVQVDGLGTAGAADAAALAGVISAEQAADPWNLWVFRVNASGSYDAESAQESRQLRTGFNASRVTPTWMQNYSGNINTRRQEFELGDGSRFIDDRYDWSVNWRVVYALAEHWSTGVRGNVGRNTRNNQTFWGQMNPAVEYSFFPYEEATRRSLTAFYEIGPVYREYFEETLLGETEEILGQHALTLDFSQRQAWGNANVRLSGSSYLHDSKLYNISLRGNLSFRIVRGLDLNVGARYSKVADQIFLSGGDLTDEERLLELQTQQTDFETRLDFGFSYQFGSIFNNVVNNRFPGGR